MNSNLFTKWMIKGLVFILLVLITSTALLMLLPPPKLTFSRMFPSKNNLLESVIGPRVIVVGGSNVAWGQDSGKLAGLLNKAVINDGLISPFGMRVILNILIPYVHSGDIVVISPEYNHFFSNDLEGDDASLAALIDIYPQALQSFNTPQLFRLPDIYISMVGGKFQGLINYLLPNADEWKFNRFGDAIYPPGSANTNDTSLYYYAFISKGQVYNPNVVDVFNRFASQARAKGATVVMVYPPARMNNCILTTQALFTNLDTYLRNHLEFPILDHPLDSCFADEYFYNSEYHLSSDGRQLRTLQLAKLLINQGIVKVNH